MNASGDNMVLDRENLLAQGHSIKCNPLVSAICGKALYLNRKQRSTRSLPQFIKKLSCQLIIQFLMSYLKKLTRKHSEKSANLNRATRRKCHGTSQEEGKMRHTRSWKETTRALTGITMSECTTWNHCFLSNM